MIVKHRGEMARILSERMTRTYTELSERQELEPDTSLLKTYLLEAHLPESRQGGRAAVVLASRVIPAVFRDTEVAVEIHRSEEPSLLTVEVMLPNERFFTYLDMSNPRYWLLHSTGSSNSTDWLVGRLVAFGPELDHAWLPADFLETLSKKGAFRGLSLDYDRRLVPDVDFQAEGAPVEFLKMQLWGNKAGEVLRILRQEGAFPHETTLSKVKVKFWLVGNVESEFSLDDIKYDGKITARGTSFESHIALVTDLYSKYAEQIRTVEEGYSITAERDGPRHRIVGEPVTFVFQRPIADLEIFCESLFSCGEPFRLWGVPNRLGEGFVVVRGVDLHVGSAIDMEIAPGFIRVFLPTGACGNTIARLYTNFQHHYDSLVTVINGEEKPVFAF